MFRLQLIFLLLLFLSLGEIAYAQSSTNRGRNFDASRTENNYLILDKKGRTKRIRFFVGDWITFQLKGDKFKWSGEITGINKKWIEINQGKISPEQFSSIVLGKDSYWANFTRSASASGAAISGIFLVSGLLSKNKVKRQDNFIISGGFFALSGIFSLFQKRKYKLGKKRQLKIIEVKPN